MLATGNPEQLRGQTLETLPWLRSRVAPLRVSEFRDTAKPRPDQTADAARFGELGMGSVLMITYYVEGIPPASWVLPARCPARPGTCSCTCS